MALLLSAPKQAVCAGGQLLLSDAIVIATNESTLSSGEAEPTSLSIA